MRCAAGGGLRGRRPRKPPPTRMRSICAHENISISINVLNYWLKSYSIKYIIAFALIQIFYIPGDNHENSIPFQTW